MDTIYCRNLPKGWIALGAVLSLLIAAGLGAVLSAATGLSRPVESCAPDFVDRFLTAFGAVALFVAPLLLIHSLFLRWYNIRRHAPTWIVWLPLLLAILAFGMLMIAEFSALAPGAEQCAAEQGGGNQAATSPMAGPMLWIARLCLLSVPLASLFAMLMPAREA